MFISKCVRSSLSLSKAKDFVLIQIYPKYTRVYSEYTKLTEDLEASLQLATTEPTHTSPWRREAL